jgi:hypothetical protein
MLTTLPTLKSRLSIPDYDIQHDALLANAIGAVSARFDAECRRVFARTVDAVHQFDAAQQEIAVLCYPIESVTQFELKTSESLGWQQIEPAPDYLIRNSCVISLAVPLCTLHSTLARITYTGGYLLPGASRTGIPPSTPSLPAAIEQAAVEQVAYWFQNRDKVGVARFWPKGGTFEQFQDLDLLPAVRAVLRLYTRWTI